MKKIFAFIIGTIFIALVIMFIHFIFGFLNSGWAFFVTFFVVCILGGLALCFYFQTTEKLCTKLRHKWNGCVCKNCEFKRDEQHEWDGCKCKLCDKIRDDERHEWDDCHCIKCGKIKENARHDLVAEIRFECTYGYSEPRGGFSYGDPCYGASCSDCEYTVYVCKTCGTERREA